MESTPQTQKRKFRWKRWLVAIGVTPLLLFILYTLFVLNWSYSHGERAGYVQKFSKKGFIVKTWEGELAMVNIPGSMTEKFYFTVRDDSVAAAINATLGRQVVLHYDQHIGIPSKIFGETEFFVIRVRLVQE
jgi:lysophospholipid acyltransferase (LPLAT)-like uncharacterized protein